MRHTRMSKMRTAGAAGTPRARFVVGRDGALHRGPRAAPCATSPFGRFGERAEIDKPVEDVEVAEHRREDRVDQAERSAGEVRPLAQLASSRSNLPRSAPAGSNAARIRRGLDGPDIGQDRGAELHPGAVSGADQRIGRMKRRRLGILEILDDHSALEQDLIADLQQRHLAERRERLEPAGWLARSTVRRSNGTPFSASAMAARCT